MTLEVLPGTLIGADGKVMSGGQVGISTVPPKLVRDMLPPGVLQHTFEITIQAPGVAAFATPLEITFPNVFEAAPGTKLNFLSFDHTTGRLVIEGTATVSADGKSVTTDPGQGITKPGWHGLINRIFRFKRSRISSPTFRGGPSSWICYWTIGRLFDNRVEQPPIDHLSMATGGLMARDVPELGRHCGSCPQRARPV